jgi:general secretion pathway protein E
LAICAEEKLSSLHGGKEQGGRAWFETTSAAAKAKGPILSAEADPEKIAHSGADGQSEAERLSAASRRYGLALRSAPLLRSPIDSELILWVRTLPIQFLKTRSVVPIALDRHANLLVIATNDPADYEIRDTLARIASPRAIQWVLAPRAAILSAITTIYHEDAPVGEEIVLEIDSAEDNGMQIEPSADILDDVSEAPVIRFVNHLISKSVRARASDIHIEPYAEKLQVRYRIDGVLYDLASPPRWVQAALISRIKIMARMNIAEKRLPQDGRMDVRIGDRHVDVRVSIIPTVFGERAVLRLLDKSSSLLHLNELGLSEDHLSTLYRLLESAYGMVLVTGPTGSGKTTTLYAVLSSMIRPAINIITIEDPVEYQLDGISQIQVNPKIDLTFAKGLRSIVRQDPDVILVGEIRDRETAEIAIQAALTGHVVFSTLHTNDSASAITRLVDIGIEPFLISSSVIAVAAQRLVRVLCPACKAAFDPDDSLLERMGIERPSLKGPVYRAVGCPVCFHTGYRGRMSIFELMLMHAEMKNLILHTYDAHQIQREARALGMIPLRADGIRKVLDGLTTFEEVLRVTDR